MSDRYVSHGGPANLTCIHCRRRGPVPWFEEVSPGHNFATLYECSGCGAVVMLADLYEDGVSDLIKMTAIVDGDWSVGASDG